MKRTSGNPCLCKLGHVKHTIHMKPSDIQFGFGGADTEVVGPLLWTRNHTAVGPQHIPTLSPLGMDALGLCTVFVCVITSGRGQLGQGSLYG